MNVISRGVRNAFRNTTRTLSIVIILGLSIGLALSMLLANKAVESKINSVKSSVDNTVTITPAGFSSFSEANNALTTSQLNGVKSINHVTGLTENLTDRLTTQGSQSFGQFGNNSSNNTTSLTSPVTLNPGASGQGGGGGRFFVFGGGGLPANFSLPITIIGTTDPSSVSGTSITLSSGQTIDGTKDNNQALISSDMATKNNLKVGSTFSAYSANLTVSGIFSSSNRGVNNSVVVSLPTEESLSNQSGAVTNAVATVDSIDNLSSTTQAIKNSLGSSADVVNSQDQANQAVQPLNSVKSISLYSLIGAIVAGGVIILMVMIMIVRERTREIGVIKAIGASNIRIAAQFMTEALTLTILAALVGTLLGAIGANPITKLLVNNSSSGASPGRGMFASAMGGNFGGGPRFTTGGRGALGFFRNNFSNIHAAAGWSILIDGLVAALVIAVIGSVIASLVISKIRPAVVLRSE